MLLFFRSVSRLSSVFFGQYSNYNIVPKETIDFSSYRYYIIIIVPIGTKIKGGKPMFHVSVIGQRLHDGVPFMPVIF